MSRPASQGGEPQNVEAKIYITGRIRKSPFFEATVKAGATQFSVYNKTYLPGGYASPEAEFWSLVNDVTLWDVTCQRVVEISGPDAPAFTDYLTPRDLSKCRVGQCRYVLITNRDGGILNDPVLMRLSDDRFWLSRADSDILMWARGVAVNAGMEVPSPNPRPRPCSCRGRSRTRCCARSWARASMTWLTITTCGRRSPAFPW